MVGDEPHYPYDRPPLSKQFLAGDWPEEKLRLRAAVDPDELGLDWRLGVSAVRLDPATNTVVLSDGSELSADSVVISTGARARTLPGSHPEGVHTLRGLDDARRLRVDLEAGPSRVVVVGAGFIGAEVASTCRGLGLEVSMIEAAPAPLDRVLDRESGDAIAELHLSNGVDLRVGVGVASIEGDDRVAAVELTDGTRIEADTVVAGIGAIPNVDWLEGSGLRIDNGLVCDSICQAAPGIWAAGDVARWPNERFGGALMRVEQWDNAISQATYVAQRIMGTEDESYTPVPWLWSDQYDRKIQLAGLATKNATLIHGSVDEGVFAKAFTDDNGAFCGLLAWNRPRHAIIGRQLITAGASLDEAAEKLA